MSKHFGFFGPVTFLYAVFYAFCMFHNGSGVTFPFFIAASLLYMCFSLSKLGITLKKGSAFYMVSMMLLAVATFCTDDGRIIAFNKTGIFLLMMSLLLDQYYDTSAWKLGKYLGSILVLCCTSLTELFKPFSDGAAYFKEHEDQKNKPVWYVLLGLLVAVPVLCVVILLLAGADAVFRSLADRILNGINFGNVMNILFRIAFLFLAAYALTSCLCAKRLKEEVKDRRRGEPIPAITVTALLSLIYLLFSGIQIFGLFLGKLKLPDGYTYAEYAREGFFQLLAVSILNLVIVLVCMSFFRESKILKGILTIMSFCTFVMIVSSAMRMIIYIQYYYLTFLRILVLWALMVLFLLFAGVIASIFRDSFPLFRYGVCVVTVLYIGLAFIHPDYIIARVNLANVEGSEAAGDSVSGRGGFFRSEEPYHDWRYLADLSADAAPAILPYLDREGYNLSAFYAKDPETTLEQILAKDSIRRNREDGFGYYYLRQLQLKTENFGVRTYNISRHMALLNLSKRVH